MKIIVLQLKRMFLPILFTLLLCTTGMTKALAQEFTVGNLNYSINDAMSVTVIGHVDGSNAIGALVIPESVSYEGNTYAVTAIGDYGFYEHDGLVGSLVIPNSVTEIGYAAFSGCSGFNGTLTLGNSLTIIGSHAFEDCNGFTGDLVIPNSVSILGGEYVSWGWDWRESYAFSGCSGFNGTLTLSNSLSAIGCGCFMGCSGFTGDLVIPNTVTQIGYSWGNCEDGAFQGCSGFTGDLTILGETEIGPYAFSGCSGFSGLTLGAFILGIYDYAFYGCEGLASITALGTGGWIEGDMESIFIGVNTDIPVYVVCGDLYNFLYNPVWSSFSNIQEMDPCQWEILATAEPPQGGSVSGSGLFVYQEQANGDYLINVDLCATPNEGYTFYHWTDDFAWNEWDSLSLCYNGSIRTDYTYHRHYVAHFRPSINEVTAVANIAGGGTVTGGGVYDFGAECTLTASANEGYLFVDWTENGRHVSYDTNYSFVVTEGRNLVANFREGYGCAVVFNFEDTYGDGWNGNKLIVTDDCGYSYTLTLSEGYSGTQVLKLVQGSHITLTWVKNYWAFECSFTISYSDGTEICQGSDMSSNFLYEFDMDCGEMPLPLFNINAVANPVEGGTVSGGGEYEYGAECTLTATANDSYSFTNWTKNGRVVSTDATYTFNVIAAPATYVANFSTASYQITATTNPPRAGTIRGAGSYAEGSSVTLTATANTGYTFLNWTQNGEVVSTNAAYTFTVTGDAAYVANFSANSYTITASTNPTDAGSVTGAGTFAYGSSVTLTATANAGYTFSNWTKNGTVVSTNPTYTFTVTGDASYVANFSTASYTITATANPTEGGTVSEGGTYSYGTSVTLTATANEGYTFVNWTKDGTVVSTNPTYTFTVTEAGNYVAHFSADSYTITVSANPTEGGTVSEGGTYVYGTSVTLTATANAGYTFVNWTKDGTVVSANPTYTFTVTESGDYVAHFSADSYAITVSADPAEGGTVSEGGTYAYGTSVTLTATANEGYTFVNWTKDGTVVSTNSTYTFTVTGDASYVAHFDLQSFDITVSANPAEGGTVSDGGTYSYGTSVTLTATANEGYTFVNWTKDGTVMSTNPTYTFTVTESGDYVANFDLQSFDITVSADPAEGGTVSEGGTYGYGTSVTLTATANAGYTFVNWTRNDSVVSITPTYTFTVTESGDYVAHFSADSYTITVSADPAEGGTVSEGGTYAYGTTVTLTATANAGYTFVNWTKDGTVVSTNPTYTFTVTGDASYVAHFSADSYTITVSADPAEGGTVSEGGTYGYGTSVTLTATANEGYTFVNWTKDGTVVSTNPIYTFTVTGDASYVANFSTASYTITATANPAEGGTVSEGGTYAYGTSVTLTATANAGYTFVNWTRNDSVVSINPIYTFTVTEAASYIAHFSADSYAITVSANPAEGGTVSEGGTYAYGTSVTLTATANEGYTFVNWTKDGTVVSTNAAYTFTVTESGDYVAHFSADSYTITVSADPAEGGTFSDGGTYGYGTSVTLTATANEGYTFVNWTKDGTVVSTNPTYTFTVTGDASYVAHFSADNYAITTTADPAEGGTVSDGGTYGYGTSVTLTATANEGYTFVNWTLNGSVVSTTPTYTFTVTESGDYVAHFSADSYAITVSADPAEGGTVSDGGTYAYGTSVTLTATANAGYTFVNWTKDGTVVNTNPTYTFTVTESGDYVAHFSADSYTITVSANPTEGGTVSEGGTYGYGTSVTLTATANAGYTFVNWTKDGTVVSTNPTYTFTVTGDASYVAHFDLQSFDITVSANPTEGGTVSEGGTYSYGTSVTLTATANEGYTFVNWTKDGTVVSTNSTYTFTVTGDASYVAHFSADSYTITVSANPAEGGMVSEGGTYAYGTSVTLTATANEGYTFVNWTKDGTVVSTNSTYTFTVTGDASYVAHFSADSYAITVSANPAEGGTVSEGGTYAYGTSVTLTATANEGYTFVNWTKDGTVVSTNPTYTFTVTESGDYVANFDLQSFDITVSANPAEGGTVSEGGTYAYGTSVILTATANAGYTFVNWTRNDSVVSSNAIYTFTVTGDASYVAHFDLQSFDITVSANPAEGGTVSEGGTYGYGTSVTLTATANEGYTFVNWTKDGTVVSNSSVIEIVVTENAAYVANFIENQGELTQETDIAEGWNWWSTYIEQEGIDGLSMLENSLGESGVGIVSQAAGYTYYYPDYGWYGSLAVINNESSYKINANEPCTAVITGQEADPSQHPITLGYGWTWIGYVPSTAMDVNEALSGLEAIAGDMLKSQEGYSEFYADYGWYGSLNTIEPGTGLMYYSSNGDPVTFTYPNNGRGGEMKANLTSKHNHWKPNVYAYPDNMTVMAVVELGDTELSSDNYELAAFAANGECRGSVRLIFAEPLHRHVAFLTVSGKDAAELSFSLYDTETGMEYYDAEESLSFVANAIVGDADDLYTIHFRGTTGVDELANRVQVYPNPVNRGRCFSINIAEDVKDPVHVEIVNALGVVIETVCTPTVQTITAPNVPGVYTLRITVEGKGTVVRKLVVK